MCVAFGDGGAIQISFGFLTILNSRFVDNIPYLTSGGAIAVVGATVTITNCTFVWTDGGEGISDYVIGGAHLMVTKSIVTIASSMFVRGLAGQVRE